MDSNGRHFFLLGKDKLPNHFKQEIANELGLLDKVNSQTVNKVDNRSYELTEGTRIRKMVHQGFFSQE